MMHYLETEQPVVPVFMQPDFQGAMAETFGARLDKMAAIKMADDLLKTLKARHDENQKIRLAGEPPINDFHVWMKDSAEYYKQLSRDVFKDANPMQRQFLVNFFGGVFPAVDMDAVTLLDEKQAKSLQKSATLRETFRQAAENVTKVGFWLGVATAGASLGAVFLSVSANYPAGYDPSVYGIIGGGVGALSFVGAGGLLEKAAPFFGEPQCKLDRNQALIKDACDNFAWFIQRPPVPVPQASPAIAQNG